ncbi:MAG TPA: hypothetical protein VKU44_08090 [Terriglobia bacterium]|nr:hypothetical protein [Terriglobia bacterium]
MADQHPGLDGTAARRLESSLTRSLGLTALGAGLTLALAAWVAAAPAPQQAAAQDSSQASGKADKAAQDKAQAEAAAPKPQPDTSRRAYTNGTERYYDPSDTGRNPSGGGARIERLVRTEPAAPAAKVAQDKAQSSKTPADSAPQPAAAAAPTAPTAPASANRVYSYSDGSGTYTQTVETHRTATRDGQVETQRVRWSNDPNSVAETEVRTRNLPDGTVERETITKGDDGQGHQIAVGMVRERVKKSGDKTTTERETLNPDGEGHWNPVIKEQETESGTDQARKSVKQTLQPDISGSWKVVDREETTTKTAKDGEESHSVRQVPDAYGRMADYEVKEEHTVKQGAKETREVSLKRRDSQDTDDPKFFLVDKTVETKTASADGKTVTTHSTTESDLLPDGSYRDVESYHPRVVKETTEVTTKTADGEKKVTEVKQRDVADPNNLKPAYQVVKQTDKDGNVRQVYIPASSQ